MPAMIRVRPIEPGDGPWVVRQLEGAFGGVIVARKCVATDDGRHVGLLLHDDGDHLALAPS